MSIFVRLWLAMAVVLLAGAWLTIDLLQEQVKPSVRQAIEETLADNANLVAALVAEDLKAGRVGSPAFALRMQDWRQRRLQARIWEFDKQAVTQRLYITDAQGVVLYDSAGEAVGQDYARWNDVWLTLHGRYGVRSSRSRADDPSSSVMYVAAPVMDGRRLIGVVSLGKPGVTVQPFIERAQRQMLVQGLGVVLLTLLVAALAALWLRHGIKRVSRYALDLGAQRRPLRFRAARELNELVQAIDAMRTELEGKAHVEKLAQTLAHELKSPLTAIRASTEILRDDLPPPDRERFLNNIDAQSERLHHLAEQLLLLARLEAGHDPAARTSLDLAALVRTVLEQRAADCRLRRLRWRIEPAEGVFPVQADRFWLEQALANLVGNALDFMPESGELRVRLEQDKDSIRLALFNPGPAIPDYALPQVFDRFYTLPRPDGSRHGSGLGLTLVREVMHQSGGAVSIANVEGGVEVSLQFPRA